MDQPTVEAPVGVGVTSRRPVGPAWWALVLGAPGAVALAAFTVAMLVLDTLAYGVATVIAPDSGVVVPDSGRYGAALAVSIMIHVASAWALTRLAAATAMRAWPPVVQGLGIALLATTTASGALLLMLGIGPVPAL